MFWPLLLIVVVLALKASHPVRILCWFYIGAMITAVGVGAAIVFALQDTAVTSAPNSRITAWVDIIVGALALVGAFVLRHVGATRRRRTARQQPLKKYFRPSERVERLVESGGPLAFVGGIVATVLPGPLVIIAMTDIAQLGYSNSATMLLIVAFFLIMFTFVEVPMVGFVVAPEWTKKRTRTFNDWLGRNLLPIGIWSLTTFGGAAVARGIITILR